MNFFFSPYFPLTALVLALVAVIYFGINTIRAARKKDSLNNVSEDSGDERTVVIQGTIIRENQKIVNASEINEVIHDLQIVEHRLKSLAE